MDKRCYEECNDGDIITCENCTRKGKYGWCIKDNEIEEELKIEE